MLPGVIQTKEGVIAHCSTFVKYGFYGLGLYVKRWRAALLATAGSRYDHSVAADRIHP